MKAHDIYQAHQRIRPHIRHTPLHVTEALADSGVYLKLENQQVAGSFKPRGAFNAILKHGKGPYVAPTAGGHGVGFSYAARRLGVEAHIYLPHDADPDKIAMLKRNGALVTYFDDMPAAREAALRAAREDGFHFVSAYNDVAMIEGGGTVAIELLHDLPEIDTLVVPVGGGGLIGGMGLVLKALKPNLRIIGVQQENAPVLASWFQAGKPVPVACQPSIAEGVGAPIEEDSITWPLVQQVVDRFVLVTEDEIREAMLRLLATEKLYVEPSGAVPVAALPHLDLPTLGNTVLILTGGNVSWPKFRANVDAVSSAGLLEVG